MAIQKEKILSDSTFGNYWRITSITIDRQNLKIIGKIALFKDKAASDAGSQPMHLVKTFKFDLVLSEIAPPTNLISYTYTKIQNAANTEITKDIMGNTLETPIKADPDLSDGIAVF